MGRNSPFRDCFLSRLHVLAEVVERADQAAAQQVLVHLGLPHDQAVGRLAGHGQRVVRFVALLGAGAQDPQQLWERATGLKTNKIMQSVQVAAQPQVVRTCSHQAVQLHSIKHSLNHWNFTKVK